MDNSKSDVGIQVGIERPNSHGTPQMTHRLRAWVASIALMLALLATVLPTPSRAQAVQVPPAKVCFQATTGINGMLAVLGPITGGAGGTAGLYTNVPLVTGGAGSGATANVTVAGGAVTQVVILSPGVNYAPGDSITAASGNIGGVSGFSSYVASIAINSSLAGGTVGMYVPGTLTPSQTWQNASQTTLNTNPIGLDANGCALIYGVGTYRQILYDSLGNEVWDQLTSVAPVNPYWAGTAGGTANAITVSDPSFGAVSGQQINFVPAFTNTGPATLNVTTSSLGAVPILFGTSIPLDAGQLAPNSVATVIYDATLGSFILMNPMTPYISAPLTPVVEASSTSAAYVALGGAIPPPAGRLTLTSGVPVLSGPVVGAAAVIYTPYKGQQIPVWNGSAWALTTFNELSESLGDTTYAPAAAVANNIYDEFVCSVGGVQVLSRGPAWGSTTARSLAVARVQGYLTNSTTITNGCAAGYGVYVGTIATDTAAATVTFNPEPVAAAGGPTNGAWVGLWNQYNRVPLAASEADSNTSWTYATAAWQPADASVKNRITFVTGEAEDSVSSTYIVTNASSSSAYGLIGISPNSTTSPGGAIGSGVSANTITTVVANYTNLAALGQTYLQAVEFASGSTITYNPRGDMQLSAQFMF